MLKAIVVDDEAPARARALDLLSAHADVRVVSCAEGVSTAVRAVREQAPDLLFLDVEMRDGTGFEVLERLRGAPRLPYVIFTTAHADHAVTAFEVAAVDYLLKPLTAPRFDRAMRRARMAMGEGCGAAPDPVVEALALSGVGQTGLARRISLRCGSTTHFVDPADVEYVEADGDYVVVCGPRVELRTRVALRSLEESLARQGFLRVHRSLLVNSQRVRQVRSGSVTELVLESGKVFIVGPRFRDALERLVRH